MSPVYTAIAIVADGFGAGGFVSRDREASQLNRLPPLDSLRSAASVRTQRGLLAACIVVAIVLLGPPLLGASSPSPGPDPGESYISARFASSTTPTTATVSKASSKEPEISVQAGVSAASSRYCRC